MAEGDPGQNFSGFPSIDGGGTCLNLLWLLTRIIENTGLPVHDKFILPSPSIEDILKGKGKISEVWQKPGKK